MTRFLNILLLLAVFSSCKKQEVGPQCPTCEEEVVPTTTDVLIGCEGNFGWGNASLTLYDPVNQSTAQQVFQNVNGFSLGDVLQSFCQVEDKLYIIMNNSGKIEVIDTANYASLGTITGLNSPRFMVASNGIGYVSDLYNNGISVIDLSSNLVIDTIQTGSWTEHLLLDGDYLYIGCPDTNWVLQLHIPTSIFTDTIVVGKSPSGIVKAASGHIWMISSGGYNEEIPNLVEYDGTTTVQTFPFTTISESPSQLRYNSLSNELFYLNQDVYSFDVSGSSLPTSPVIESNSSIYYGMNIDPINSEIYVTDAVDYVQSGRVIRFDSLYNPIDTFSTGIIPQAIWFK